MTAQAEPVPVYGAERVSPLTAMRRRPLLWLLPVIVLLVPAALWASQQKPTYTAESRLVIGDLSVPARAVPAYVSATTTAATTYSELVSTSEFDDLLAKQLKVDPTVLTGKVSATPVPGSSIIAVDATAASEQAAVRYANAASQVLAAYASRLVLPQAPATLLRQYQQATAEQRAAAVTQTVDEKNLAALEADKSADPAKVSAARAQLAKDQATFDTAALKAKGISDLYEQSQQYGATSDALKPISAAQSLGSDRTHRLEVAGGGAAAAGLLLGIGLVTMLANRDERRARRRAAKVAAQPAATPAPAATHGTVIPGPAEPSITLPADSGGARVLAGEPEA